MNKTLKEVLTGAGIPPATVTQVIEALEAHEGLYSQRSRSVLIRTEARRWELTKVIQSRLGEADGGPEWFTVHHIKT